MSLFTFSSENWNRPEEEINYLMKLLASGLKDEIGKLNEHNIRLHVIGDLTRFSQEIHEGIVEAEQSTSQNTGLNLVIAANYGGRWDIVQTAQKLAKAAVSGEIKVEDIDESIFSKYIMLADLPEPDLFIRTSGEIRISNFFLWQLAYCELYFTDILWPDFDYIKQAVDSGINTLMIALYTVRPNNIISGDFFGT